MSSNSPVHGQRRRAPWPDFKGRRIFEGDTIVHPDGTKGIVIFKGEFEEPGDQWRVDYGLPAASRLCLQIGDRGQAVVLSDYQAPAAVHMSIRNCWSELGDDFDGSVITLSEPAFNVFHKVFNRLSVDKLKAMDLTPEEVEIALRFAHLY
jgi:hypothetical protein